MLAGGTLTLANRGKAATLPRILSAGGVTVHTFIQPSAKPPVSLVLGDHHTGHTQVIVGTVCVDVVIVFCLEK